MVGKGKGIAAVRARGGGAWFAPTSLHCSSRAVHADAGLAAADADATAAAASRQNQNHRWDEDVVFKNQTRGEVKAPRRFINDTVRSDFHRRFLERYIR